MFGGIFNSWQKASWSAFSKVGPQQTMAIRCMSKLKTHKGTAKRWKAISKGLYLRRQAGLRHLNRRMSPDTRRGKHAAVVCTDAQRRHLNRLLPYQ